MPSSLEFDLVADVGVAEVDQRPVEHRSHLDEHVLLAPRRGHRQCRHVVGCVGAEALDVAADRRRLGSQVCQHFAQRGLGELGRVDAAKALLDVVEAVIERAQLQRDEPVRVGVVADAPVRAVWRVGH